MLRDPLDLLGTERIVLDQVLAEFRAGRTSDHDDTSSARGTFKNFDLPPQRVITLALRLEDRADLHAELTGDVGRLPPLSRRFARTPTRCAARRGIARSSLAFSRSSRSYSDASRSHRSVPASIFDQYLFIVEHQSLPGLFFRSAISRWVTVFK